jgi:hypothetical protein
MAAQMHVSGIALNPQGQQAPNAMHQQAANAAHQQAANAAHQQAVNAAHQQAANAAHQQAANAAHQQAANAAHQQAAFGFAAPQNFQPMPQVPFPMQAMQAIPPHPLNNANQLPQNALNVATQQIVNHQGVNPQGANHGVAIQGFAMPGVLTQQAIQAGMLNHQRIADAQGNMFPPFQVPLVNPAQAFPGVQAAQPLYQQHTNQGAGSVNTGGNTQNPNREVVRRERALNMWIAFRSK